MIRCLAFGCFLILPPLCHAAECKIKIATERLQAAIGDQVCVQKAEVKLCAPQGKEIKSSDIKDLDVSGDIDLVDREVKNIDGNCVEATITVRARSIFGPSIWQHCQRGSYGGQVELVYCR